MHDLLATCRVVQSQDADRHVNDLTGTEHMVIIVTFKDGSKWLTDVGFGGEVPRHPLRIDQLDLDPPKDSRTYGELQTNMTLCFLPRTYVVSLLFHCMEVKHQLTSVLKLRLSADCSLVL